MRNTGMTIRICEHDSCGWRNGQMFKCNIEHGDVVCYFFAGGYSWSEGLFSKVILEYNILRVLDEGMIDG